MWIYVLSWGTVILNNEIDLERVQKSALKVILKDKYGDYKSALRKLNIESLFDRRELLCLKFAKKGLKLANFKNVFPIQGANHTIYFAGVSESPSKDC